MPRIDPAQLLKCLGVLLSSDGGIKSKLEVQRLAGLMGKFSKKLVSKCIYLQILKKTDTELLGAFMASNGWSLIHTWLDDGIKAKNWPLIEELLELLLLCPVHVEILKTNNCPKLVKELSKLGDEPSLQKVKEFAVQVVGQWLKLVKGERTPQSAMEQNSQPCNDSNVNEDDDSNDKISDETNFNEIDSKDNPLPILKISVKDGKQVVSKVTEKTDRKSSDKHSSEPNFVTSSSDNSEKDNDKNKKKKDSSKISSSSDRSSSSTSKNKHSTSERRHSSSSNNSDSSKSKHKSKSSSGHRDSDKKVLSKSRNDKHRESDKSKDRSEKYREHSDKRKDDRSKENTDKNKDSSDKSKDHSKNRETPKVETPSIMKLGKIPKKSSTSKSEVKKEKPSISIEVRNPNEANRPKTVKMFNSKFRSHGLEEEAKPPPPRGSVKKPAPPTGLPTAQKRPSPIRTFDAPPEKKTKVAENVERPGAIKLIPPKPKPTYLLESGSFMDALTASATNKKEPRKRKRRISGSKDNNTSGDGSPPASPTTPQTPTSPTIEESKSTPLRFYQDTLDTEDDDKDKENRSKSPLEDVKNINIIESPMSPCDKDDAIKLEINEDDPPPPVILPGGIRSVLSVHKRKGPKKSLTWRTNIQDVQYFELDETERVNVTKTFSAMKQMEHIHEREAFKKGRNIANDDFMEEKTMWRKLIPIDDLKGAIVQPGVNSKEKEIQKARQEKVMQAMYFNSKIPDSPAEADHEILPVSEPVTIPLEDVTGATESVNNFQNTPWPEPKITPPTIKPNSGMPNPQMFPNGPPFNPGYNGMPFGMPGPGYQQGMMAPMSGGEWVGNGSSMMMNEGMPNPDMFMGPGPGPGPGMGPGSMFPGQSNDYTMMDVGSTAPSGFQPGFNNQMGPGGPPMGMNRPMAPYGFKSRGGVRGPAPRGGHMGWRSKGPGNWNGPHRGGSGHRGNGRLCTHFQKKGFCRHGDSCPFVHSGGVRSHF